MFFFILIFLFNASCEQIISLNISHRYYLPLINLQFKGKEKEFSVQLNNQIQTSQIDSIPYDQFAEECKLEKEASYKGGREYKLYFCSSNIGFNQKFLSPLFYFYVTKNQMSYIDSRNQGVSMSFSNLNQSHSIIHQLFKNKEIGKLQFAFQYINETDNYIHIGGVPNIEQLLYPHQAKCLINQTAKIWGCDINKIYIGRKEYIFNVIASFHSAVDGFIESRMFFNFMKEIVLKKQVSSNKCEPFDDFDSKDILYCEKGSLEGVDDLTFVFNNFTFTIPIKELFIFNGHSYFSKFSYDFYDLNKFDFGYQFIRLFNLSLFDYDKAEISFYTYFNGLNQKITTYNIEYILLSIILICSFNSIFLYFHYRKIIK